MKMSIKGQSSKHAKTNTHTPCKNSKNIQLLQLSKQQMFSLYWQKSSFNFNPYFVFINVLAFCDFRKDKFISKGHHKTKEFY
jgi:hypothetical protein